MAKNSPILRNIITDPGALNKLIKIIAEILLHPLKLDSEALEHYFSLKPQESDPQRL